MPQRAVFQLTYDAKKKRTVSMMWQTTETSSKPFKHLGIFSAATSIVDLIKARLPARQGVEPGALNENSSPKPCPLRAC